MCMDRKQLYSFEDIVRDMSEKYSIPFEITECIIRDWCEILYRTVSPTGSPNLFDLEG